MYIGYYFVFSWVESIVLWALVYSFDYIDSFFWGFFINGENIVGKGGFSKIRVVKR